MAIARNLTQRENRTPAPGPFPNLRPRTPPRAVASRARDLCSSSNASFFFPLTLAMNPSDPSNRRGKSCKMLSRNTRIVREKWRISDLNECLCYSIFSFFFLFFFKRKSKVKDQKFGEDVETNLFWIWILHYLFVEFLKSKNNSRTFERFSFFFFFDSYKRSVVKLSPTNGVENYD